MVILRVLYRTLALLAITAGAFFALLLFIPFKTRYSRWQLRWRNRIFRWWAVTGGRIIGMRARLTGTPPSGPFFLVSNHLGYVDIFLLGSHVDAAFVAKADLRRWPALGRVFATADTIFIDRSRRKDVLRVTELIENSMRRGLGILLFPEGTSGKGEGILPFKPSLLDFAARQEQPIHFACLSYRTPPGASSAQEVVCWWGDTPFLPHAARLFRLPYFEASLHFCDEPVRGTDRKALANRLRAAMVELFEPVG